MSFNGRGRPEATLDRRAVRGETCRSSTSWTQLLPERRQSEHVPGFGLVKPHSWQR